MARVLAIDDERPVLEVLSGYCEEAGHEVVTACDGREALRLFLEHRPELLLVDIRMPVMDGFELISRVRELSDVPIIVLSALGEVTDKVRGLQLGADDYLAKPVGFAELEARIGAVLRRAQRQPQGTAAVYSDGLVTIHHDRREAYVRDEQVSLTPREYGVLSYLTRNAGRVVTVREMLEQVWGSPYHSEEVVKWHVSMLRRKLGDDTRRPRLIVTVWGTGYRYEPPQ